jgi:hypothetical protein
MRRSIVKGWILVAGLVASAGCGGGGSTATSLAPNSSEVAVGLVSGTLYASAGTTVGLRGPAPRRSMLGRLLQGLSPIGRAEAATWTCTGGSLVPAFAGPSHNPYAFTPRTCTIDWSDGRTATSEWSGPFTLNYGGACDDVHPWIGDQAAGCTLTRTTGADGNSRTITGPQGNQYAIRHDTHGAGTGWDSTVSPAPGDGGVVVTCGSGGCAGGGGTLAIGGSHVTGTATPSGGTPVKVWDHTLSTPVPLTLTVTGGVRTIGGAVTVQHNLLHYDTTTTFHDVGYGLAGCCFPSSGSVTTTFTGRLLAGKTETLAFSGACGEGTLTTTDGKTVPFTLTQCL